MKKLLLKLLALIASGTAASAQVAWTSDAVTVGAGYTKDVYYSMQNGEVKSEANTNWQLAFSFSMADSAAVWANHSKGVMVFNIHKDSSQWNSVTLADTATADRVFNNDQGWYQGAFNDIPSANPFDFGWGVYSPVNHKLTGDSLFIVRHAGNYYKMLIDEYDAGNFVWTFTIGDFAGNAAQHNISKNPTFDDRLFGYFSFASADTNREPDINTWDIVFTRYTTDDPLSGSQPNNNVTGVLANRGVQCVKAEAVHVDSAHANYYANHNSGLSNIISTVGYNWKSFTGSGWAIPDSVSYFIKGKSGLIYQMQFTSFGGQATGDIEFNKRLLATVSVNDINSNIDQYKMYPVPTSEALNVVLSSRATTDVEAILYDFSGKVVLRTNLALKQGLNAYSIPVSQFSNGMYMMAIKGDKINIADRILIKK